MNKNLVHLVVFGPGIGESIVINIPDVGWGVIDSCLWRIKRRKHNPALAYLKSKQVSRLAFIILTHPHSDHFQGLDQIIEQYSGRIERICYYSGDGLREYRTYLAKKKVLGEPGLRELGNIFKWFEEAKKKGAKIVRLSERTEIIRKTRYGDHDIEIIALSPSAESVNQYVELFHKAIPTKDGDVVNVLHDSHHNLLASALYCQIGQLTLILGSDLEIGNTDQTGWRGVLGNKDSPKLSAHVVKVPHHGSETAFYEPAWRVFSQHSQLASVITPYIRSSPPLPRGEILRKISKYSNIIAITAKTKAIELRKRYDRTIIQQFQGVRKWRCFVDPRQIGSVIMDLCIDDGTLANLDVVKPAYLWNSD
jgi:beta-lactamase superfamily II metal-dependent hydrolase